MPHADGPNAAERTELRALLASHRADAQRRIDALDADLVTVAGSRDAAGADDEHDPEGATLSDEWSRLAGLRDDALEEAARIDAARSRIDDDGFGVCVDCGRPIPVQRLLVIPSATRCVPCATRAR